MSDVFGGLGILVEALSKPDFLKVRETLTRVGKTEGKTLQQTCYVLHKRGQYAIMHYKEMKVMDGEYVDMTEEDIGHRNTVAHLLDQWGLLQVQDPEDVKSPRSEPGGVVVIPHKEKAQYALTPLYEIGKPRY